LTIALSLALQANSLQYHDVSATAHTQTSTSQNDLRCSLQLRRKDRKTGTPLQADFISFGYEISLSSVRIPKNKKLKQAKEASPGYLSK